MINGNLLKSFLILCMLAIGLTGCNLYGPEETTGEIDPPPLTLELNDEFVLEGNVEGNLFENTENVIIEEVEKRQLVIYFFDDKDNVVPLTLDIPKVEGIAHQVLEYMTIGGPAEALLPSGFRPVIPEGTTFTTNIKADEKLAIIDFSKEFLNYKVKSSDEEKRILDAITWSMTEFPTVEKVELRVNGYELEKMPIWSTPVISPLSRTDGINLELANNINISNTTAVTLYFYRVNQDFEYLIPITRLIPKTDNIAKATLEQLIIGPKAGTNLISSLLPTTRILSVKVSNGSLVADFDEDVLGFDKQLSNRLIDMIVFSLTETVDISTIQIQVMGKTEALPDALTQPVMRPNVINASLF